jgi:N4-gp56 family major capsid protein
MTVSTVATANTVKQWDAAFYKEYIRANRFARYQGTDSNSIIQLKETLTKKPGDAITVSLVKALSGAGVTGNTLLEGQEEAIANYGHQITIGCYRQGVALTSWEEQKTAMAMRDHARPLLKDWAMELNRDKTIAALASVKSPADASPVAYGSASETQKDLWLDENTDRILFGAAVGNLKQTAPACGATNDHSASLAEIDNTSDKLTKELVSLAKRRAKLASPIVRPVRVNDDEEWYVMFAGSLAFRDLKASLASSHADAMQRGKSNPLFVDGDLMWDGVIIREVPEIAAFTNGTIDVSANYLCGAQAVGHVIGKRWASKAEERDYGFVNGVAIEGYFGTEKLFFNDVQHGVVTVYSAAVADA